MKYTLTIDISLVRTDPVDTAIETLKRWQTEKKIELVEANRPRNVQYTWPGATPSPAPRDPRARSNRMRKDADAASFKTVAGIVFPTRDPQKLNMSEINGVTHLIKHHKGTNQFFVTNNSEAFISNGKRERLKGAFGIITMTPAETVDLLSNLEGWS